MSDWRASTWGEEISLEYGKALRDYDKASGKYRVFGSNGPIGWTDKTLAPGPGVILGRKGAYRGIEFSRAPFFVIDTAYYVVPKGEFDMRWLYYAIKHHKLGEIDDGSPIPSTTRSAVYVRDIDVPPLTEQKAIAAVLGALDDKIELNRRMNATLEAMARALFQSWFIDFDPVRANMDRNQPSTRPVGHPSPTGRRDGDEGASGMDFDPVRAKLDGRHPANLDPATAALFPDSFQDSALGEIPHGWRLGTLGELVQLRTDRVDATPAKDSTRYIALEDMPSKSIDLSNFQLGSAVNSSITAFRKGDVLFGSMRPYFHKVGLAFFDGITRTTTFVLRPRKDCFRHFALLHFFSDDVVAHSTTASVGTTIPYVRWDSMESYRIPVPPDALLEAFEKTVSPLVQRIAAQGEESRTLTTLRDTLLPKLLSGELSTTPEN
jgi:type I restriction enzyme S subunit